MSKTTAILDFKNMKWAVNGMPIDGLGADQFALPDVEEMFNIQYGADGSIVLYPKPDVDNKFTVNFLPTSQIGFKLYKEAKKGYETGSMKHYTFVGESKGTRVTIKGSVCIGWPKGWFPDTKSEDKQIQLTYNASSYETESDVIDTITDGVGEELVGLLKSTALKGLL